MTRHIIVNKHGMPDIMPSVIYICVVLLLLFISWLTVVSQVPRSALPSNVLVLLPLFLIQSREVATSVAITIIPGMFSLWCWPLMKASGTVPRRSIALLLSAIALSISWHAWGYSTMVRFQGPQYARTVLLTSVIWWTLLGLLAVLGARRPSRLRSVQFHVALFLWLTWYAFPYFGDLP